MLKTSTLKLSPKTAFLYAAVALPLLPLAPLSAAVNCMTVLCDTCKPTTSQGKPAGPQELELKVGQTRTFAGGLTVNFVGVQGDSRCPSDADCVWAGSAKVALRVKEGTGKVKAIELNTGMAPKQMTIGMYDVELLGLSPYPMTTVKIDRNSYVARIRVTPHKKAAAPVKAKWQPLFSTESWYREQAGVETVFKGTLQALPSQDGKVTTLMRTNYYSLGGRMLYTGTYKNALLNSLIGKKVVIRGKAVDMELEGQKVNEIWPAAIRIAG